VDERVIVPRSYIAEMLRENRQDETRICGLSPISVLDLCTGSGCLAILAALEWPGARVDAADISQDALDVARINVDAYGLAGRIRLVRSDLFAALGRARYDLILSNPPYVKSASMKRLPDEYRKEPRIALASGEDGLAHTRAILAQARRHLKPGGRLVVEIGHNRKALERAYPGLPFEWPRTSGGRGFVFVLGAANMAVDSAAQPPGKVRP
jgi:ribosomal protein L3 glutamine methyltransferase